MMMNSRVWLLAAACLAPAGPAWSQGFTLPDGPGKELVAESCGGCHAINRLGAGYTPEGWRTIERMMRNMDVPIPNDKWPTVTAYLIKAFPEKPKPAAVVIAGPVQATIKQWPVPTPGSRPHDPLATRDGMIWYTGQLAGVLGRLDPKTGKVKEFRLKTAHTGPHGLVEDKAGNVWFTGNSAQPIANLDPHTGVVSVHPM